MHCRFLQPRFWGHKKSRDRTLEGGVEEMVVFGGDTGELRRDAEIRGDKMYLCRRNIEM